MNRFNSTGINSVSTPNVVAAINITTAALVTPELDAVDATTNILPVRATNVIPIIRIAQLSSSDCGSASKSMNTSGSKSNKTALKPKTVAPVFNVALIAEIEFTAPHSLKARLTLPGKEQIDERLHRGTSSKK